MPLDKFGLPFLYPTKKTAGVSGSGTGFFWQQENDIRNDDHVGSLDDVSNVNTTTGEFQIDYGSSDSWVIWPDPSFENSNSIGGCDMDFAASANRGYGWKAIQPRDIELKMLIKVIDGNNEGLSLGSGTGKHSGDGCCSGFNYMFNIFLSDDPVKFRFRKEMWHVNYDDDPKTGQWTDTTNANFQLEDVNDRWVGFAFCRYDLKDFVSNGQDGVACEAWINPDADDDPTNWIMMKRTIDTGGWGDGGSDCNGEDDQIGTWSNGAFRIKSDSGVVIKFKNCSLREIDPTLSFDDDPEDPGPVDPPTSGTTTVQGLLTFQQDINTIRGASQCAGTGLGGGGGSGNTIFFTKTADFDKELSNSSTWSYRIRVAEQVVTTSSIFNGKLVKQLDIWLKKVGTPTTPNVKAKIWNSSGNIVYESATALDPSTLSTSYTKNAFDFSDNTHVMVPGDRIGVEWTGTSASSYVVAGYQDDPNTASVYNSWHIDEANWSDVVTRDFACDAWE